AAPQQSRDGARAEVSEATTLERPATAPSGGGPTFEDIAGLVSMSPAVQTREKKIEPAKPFLEPAIKDDFTYTLAEPITPAISAVRDSSPATLRNPASAGDFLSKGMLASAPSDSSSSPLSGRMPVVLAGAALALGALSFGLYLMHGRKTVAPAAKVAVIDQPSAPEPAPAAAVPEPVEAPQSASSQDTTQTQPVAPEQAEPVAAVAPVPATITSSGDTEPPKVRRQEKNTSAGKPPDLSSSRRPVIPNLRINSPSAPNQTLASTNAGTVVPAEIAPPETTGEAPAAGFLSAVARTPNQPAPPPSAPGPAPVVKTIRDAKLISSTRPVYPAAAKASNIQGSVVISADIDANGNVVGAKAISGPVFLRQAASDAVKQWKYSPALVDGKPAPSQTTVSVDFRLN
ncbi:MAG TPA: energy transducer TonB, partial [Candidatus Solibacter sp.]|nr:energy transducer TonB [Candidatus Solibacter sp.]